MRYRIKCYEPKDLGNKAQLEQAFQIIDAFDSHREYNINDVIELDQIRELMKLYKQTLGEEENFNRRMSIVKKFGGIIVGFCKKITVATFIETFKSLDPLYADSFWPFLFKYDLQSVLSDGILLECQKLQCFSLFNLLKCKAVVAAFDQTIAKIIRNSKDGGNIIALNLFEKTKTNIHLPKSLLPAEYNNIFTACIESENLNVSYCRLLSNLHLSKEFHITSELRLKAKRRYETVFSQSLRSSGRFKFSVHVMVAESNSIIKSEKRKNEQNNEHLLEFTYARQWVEKHLDEPTLLNNIIYLFRQFDSYMCSMLPSRNIDISLLENLIGASNRKGSYPIGLKFQEKTSLSSLQLTTYDALLQANGLSIEKLCEWFFTTYLKAEFHIENYIFKSSSKGTSLEEHCRTLAVEIERSLRQYKVYLDVGKIDYELLQLSQDEIRFSEIGSLVKKKYAYEISNDLKREERLLFSEQSELFYSLKDKAFNNTHFCAILANGEKVCLSDYNEHIQKEIKWLIERGTLFVNSNGTVQLNTEKALILYHLYTKEVLCLKHYTTEAMKIVDDLVANNEITIENTLLTRPEQEYMNYILNRKQFDNGLNLRNAYLHGHASLDEDRQRFDYYEFLKVLLIIVVKINDDLCLWENENNATCQNKNIVQIVSSGLKDPICL